MVKTSESWPHGARPDIVIHRRTLLEIASNLLVIELKKEQCDRDGRTVIEFTTPPALPRSFQYQHGLTMRIDDRGRRVELTWFAGGQQSGEPSFLPARHESPPRPNAARSQRRRSRGRR